jgi:hypothetical protein
MPTFTVSLTYSYRVERTTTLEVEAADALAAEKAAVELAEIHSRLSGGDDFDVSDISVVEVAS